MVQEPLFEKLIVIQLLKKWNPKVYYHVHKSPSLGPVLSQMSSVPTNASVYNIDFNSILQSAPASS
jgi:hypothetical protein